jgi:hypothetical protein
MKIDNLEKLENRMAEVWAEILSRPFAKEIQSILGKGDRKLYALWLCQVAHLTQHTSAHQARVGMRIGEISFPYAKFCFEHAAEEVGHEMMAVHDLRKIGARVEKVSDLPPAFSATQKLTAYLYFAAEHAHPNTRLGFSYWAEKCYPYLQMMVANTQKALNLENRQMTFFVSHAVIDEKHARDVEHVIGLVCKTPADWAAVETGMIDTLEMAVNIFEEIHRQVSQDLLSNEYRDFLDCILENRL